MQSVRFWMARRASKLGLALLFAIAFSLSLLLPHFVAVPAAPLSGEVVLMLEGGLQRGSGGQAESKRFNLQWDLQCDRNTCEEEVWGYGAEFNKADHQARLQQFQIRPQRLQFQMQAVIHADKWTEPGAADYQIDLRRQGDRLEGSFRGLHNGEPVAGKAWGKVRSLNRPAANFVPPKPREHPRLLFRRTDLPALRDKAKTPFGQAVVAQLRAKLAETPLRDASADDALGYGLLYQLYSKQSDARAARQILQRRITTPIHPGPHDRPAQALPMAFAYDLIYETCDRSLHRDLQIWLHRQADILASGRDRTDFNPTPWSNWNGIYRSVLGTIALTLWDEPGWQAPPPPAPPVMTDLAPVQDLDLDASVPINPLEAERVPTQWLVAGPFPLNSPLNAPADPLASLGGVARARPPAGTTVKLKAEFGKGGSARTFQPLSPQFLWNHPRYTQGETWLDIASPVQNSHGRIYFYTVLENQEPGWYRAGIRTRYGNAVLYLAGQRLVENDAVYLKSGRYPLMVEARVGPRSGWKADSSRQAIAPRFIPTTAADAEQVHAQRRWIYDRLLANWQAEYKRDRADPDADDWSHLAARNLARYLSTALGDWGWNSEGQNYTQWTMDLVLPYLHAYRNVLGIDLQPSLNLGDAAPASTTNVQHFLPLDIARTVYRQPLTLNAFGSGDRTAGLNLFASGFAATAPDYQPAALWAWNQLLGINRGELAEFDSARTAALTLVNYPLDAKPRPPEEVLPAAIRDRQKGGYVFRDRSRPNSDLIAQVYLKSDLRRAAWWYVGDGTFRIDGLGHAWAVKGAQHKHQVQDRRFENVVQFPEDAIGGFGGEEIAFQAATDGSGSISASLNRSYRGQKTVDGKRLKPINLYGEFLEENTEDLGIRGVRAFAADYSGLAGVPGLFVVADRLSGGGSKIWQMVTPAEHDLTIDGNTFTLTAPDGTNLHGSFIAPTNVTLAPLSNQTFEYSNLKGQPQKNTVPLRGIQATGGNTFFVVMTLQRGEAPPVQVSGSGLAAKVTVGKQAIRFQDDRLLVRSRD